MTAQLHRPPHQGYPNARSHTKRKRLLVIAATAAEDHGFTLKEILGPCRAQGIARARRQAMREAHALGFGVCDIARAFKRTHGAVSHAINPRRR